MTVTTTAGCAWTASVNGSWITLTAGVGQWARHRRVSVAANSATESRTAAVTIGGQAHAVTQEGRPPAVCAYEVAPDSSTWGTTAEAGRSRSPPPTAARGPR